MVLLVIVICYLLKKGNALVFNPEKVAKVGRVYNSKINIQANIIITHQEVEKKGNPESPEGSEGSTAKDCNSTDNVCAENSDRTTSSKRNLIGKSMLPVLFDPNFRDKQLANVSAHWLKPSEPSAMNVGCSSVNDKNGDGKPTTATISALTTNAATTITATATNIAVYRLGHTATWGCRNCKIKADKWFMQIHDCSGKR
jgi:hypothetical protein